MIIKQGQKPRFNNIWKKQHLWPKISEMSQKGQIFILFKSWQIIYQNDALDVKF